MMPPPGSGIPALSEDEKMTFARWIDLGCPISSPNATLATAGWFVMTLLGAYADHRLAPCGGHKRKRCVRSASAPMSAYSGLDRASLSVVANFAVNGKAVGTELGRDFTEAGDHVWTLLLAQPLSR